MPHVDRVAAEERRRLSREDFSLFDDVEHEGCQRCQGIKRVVAPHVWSRSALADVTSNNFRWLEMTEMNGVARDGWRWLVTAGGGRLVLQLPGSRLIAGENLTPHLV